MRGMVTDRRGRLSFLPQDVDRIHFEDAAGGQIAGDEGGRRSCGRASLEGL
jgi:hypothetical protein